MSEFRRRLIMQMSINNTNMNIININQTITDPAKMITGDINKEIIQWINQNSHRVLAKKTGEGTITYCELDDTDSNKYYNGSTASLSGSEGDVFVKLPTFYYAGNDNGYGFSGDYVKLKFSKEPFNGCIEWDTNILIGAYEAYIVNNKLYSISGVNSAGIGSQQKYKSFAKARGNGYQLIDWQMHCVIACLFYAKYGTTNSNSICGEGVIGHNKITGQTNTIGMEDTKSNINGNTMSINFWGLENWWGNKIEYMNEDDIGKYMYVYDPANKYTRQINIIDKQGYPLKFKFGKYMDLIAISEDDMTGSKSTGFCSYQFWDSNKIQRTLTRSGDSNSGSLAVIDELNGQSAEGSEDKWGTRLAFRGICTKETNVIKFRNLPIL